MDACMCRSGRVALGTRTQTDTQSDRQSSAQEKLTDAITLGVIVRGAELLSGMQSD